MRLVSLGAVVVGGAGVVTLALVGGCGPRAQSTVLARGNGAGQEQSQQETPPQQTPPPPPARGSVACGARTCGPDEYCEIRCTCCGMRVPNPSEQSGEYLCHPLPPECATSAEGICGGTRQRQTPCA